MRTQQNEKNINLQIAISFCRDGKFEDSFPYFNKCFRKITLKNGTIITSDNIRAEAYYYMAKYGYDLNTLELDELNNLIKKGLSIANNEILLKKLKKLKDKLSGNSNLDIKEKKIGIIDYFNLEKKFGFIRSENELFYFHISGFIYFINSIQMEGLEGKEVLFYNVNNPKKTGKMMAFKIEFSS